MPGGEPEIAAGRTKALRLVEQFVRHGSPFSARFGWKKRMGNSLSMMSDIAELDRSELEPVERFYGLSAAAWLKIGIVSVLMLALFRFNLARLWLKTNPVTGE